MKDVECFLARTKLRDTLLKELFLANLFQPTDSVCTLREDMSGFHVEKVVYQTKHTQALFSTDVFYESDEVSVLLYLTVAYIRFF